MNKMELRAHYQKIGAMGGRASRGTMAAHFRAKLAAATRWKNKELIKEARLQLGSKSKG